MYQQIHTSSILVSQYINIKEMQNTESMIALDAGQGHNSSLTLINRMHCIFTDDKLHPLNIHQVFTAGVFMMHA